MRMTDQSGTDAQSSVTPARTSGSQRAEKTSLLSSPTRVIYQGYVRPFSFTRRRTLTLGVPLQVLYLAIDSTC